MYNQNKNGYAITLIGRKSLLGLLKTKEKKTKFFLERSNIGAAVGRFLGRVIKTPCALLVYIWAVKDEALVILCKHGVFTSRGLLLLHVLLSGHCSRATSWLGLASLNSSFMWLNQLYKAGYQDQPITDQSWHQLNY